jgi:hypothetical protein
LIIGKPSKETIHFLEGLIELLKIFQTNTMRLGIEDIRIFEDDNQQDYANEEPGSTSTTYQINPH